MTSSILKHGSNKTFCKSRTRWKVCFYLPPQRHTVVQKSFRLTVPLLPQPGSKYTEKPTSRLTYIPGVYGHSARQIYSHADDQAGRQDNLKTHGEAEKLLCSVVETPVDSVVSGLIIPTCSRDITLVKAPPDGVPNGSRGSRHIILTTWELPL